jgi:hypothetical protein
VSVYGQTNRTQTTTLPPVQMEPVGPEDADPTNSTVISEDNSSGYLQYEDTDIGFKFDYPSYWRVVTADFRFNILVIFWSPDNTVQVDVRLTPQINSQSLKSFGDSYYKKDENMKISAYYRNSSTLLGGQPAIRVIGFYLYNPTYLDQLSGAESSTSKLLATASLLKEKKGFLQVIYFADKSTFKDYLPQVEHMIKSFQFINTKPVIQED